MIEYVINDKFTRRAELRRSEPQASACSAWVSHWRPTAGGLSCPIKRLDSLTVRLPRPETVISGPNGTERSSYSDLPIACSG
jgi:hypothetical protein